MTKMTKAQIRELILQEMSHIDMGVDPQHEKNKILGLTRGIDGEAAGMLLSAVARAIASGALTLNDIQDIANDLYMGQAELMP